MTEQKTASRGYHPLPYPPPLSGRDGRGVLCFMFCVLCFVFFSPELHAEPRIPEKFTYYLFWSGIRAGMAAIVSEDTPEGVIIKSSAKSAEFISIFYKVEDLAQSILYHDGYPHTYILKIREGRHRRDKATFFEAKSNNGTQKVTHLNKLDNEETKFDLEKQAYDPLSGLYAIRKRQLTVGHSEYIDIFDSKKLWNVEVQVLRKERVTTPAGKFNTIVIKPLLQSEGIFMKKGEINIWLTDDEKKIPVMMKSKVKIGNFTAQLTDGAY